jgi:phospholipid-binding lipoprotein MlaA
MAVAAASMVAGCASTPIDRRDQWEQFNRVSYKVNDKIDKYFVEPVARGYKFMTPTPFRLMVTNFMSHAGYLNVILHDILQLKGKQTAQDMTRFVVNSTIGWGGLADPATGMGFPRHFEDFGQTLATWGFSQGPYLVIPLQGPDTLRNLPNYGTLAALTPFFYMSTIYTAPIGFLAAINARANLLEATKIRDEAALDPYTFTREAYLQKLLFEIYDGHPPKEYTDETVPREHEEHQKGGVLRVF